MVLTDLKQGQSATIRNISSLDQMVKKRLTDFGLHVGSKIQYKRSMPFGGPFVIEMKGQSIAIRKKDAGKIEVNL